MKKWQNDVEFHEELRQCSISAYNPYEKGIPKGYKLVAVSKVDPSTGFAAIALQKGDEIVIAFRGTELDKDDNIDFKNDIAMVLKNLPEQFKCAKDFVKTIESNPKLKNKNITLTGHSLGGSLAQLIGAMYGYNTVTFNPYGTKNILDKYNLRYKEDNIINYCNRHDVITTINSQNHPGIIYEMESNSEGYGIRYHKLENQRPITQQRVITPEELKENDWLQSMQDKSIFNNKDKNESSIKDYFNEVTNDSRIFSFEDVINIPQEEAYFYQEALDYQYGKIGFPKEKELQKSPYITKVPPFTYDDGSVTRAHYRSIGGNKFINPAKPSMTTPSMEKNRIDNYIDKVFKKNSPIFEYNIDERSKNYRWETNKGACDKCKELDNKEFESKEDIPPKPHPNCKCEVKEIKNKFNLEKYTKEQLKNFQDSFYKDPILSKLDYTRAKEYYQIALTNGEAIDTIYPANIKTTVGQLKDMNLRNHISQIKGVNNNTMVVIPKQNAKIVEKIKMSHSFKECIKKAINAKEISSKKSYQIKPINFAIKSVNWDVALVVGHAHLYNTHFDMEGNLYTTLIDLYDFDKFQENDIFDLINNNAYEQQERGVLTNYVLVIPIVLTETELNKL